MKQKNQLFKTETKKEPEVSKERKRIQNFEQGLLATGDPVDAVLADVIKVSTDDGKSLSLGNLDPGISSIEMYNELVKLGILVKESREVVTIKYTYKSTEIYEDHFVNKSEGVKLKAASLLLVDNLFLEKAKENIRFNQGN